MTITLLELKADEKEAIRKYEEYEHQGLPKNQVQVIKRIKLDEMRHLKLLKRFK